LHLPLQDQRDEGRNDVASRLMTTVFDCIEEADTNPQDSCGICCVQEVIETLAFIDTLRLGLRRYLHQLWTSAASHGATNFHRPGTSEGRHLHFTESCISTRNDGLAMDSSTLSLFKFLASLRLRSFKIAGRVDGKKQAVQSTYVAFRAHGSSFQVLVLLPLSKISLQGPLSTYKVRTMLHC